MKDNELNLDRLEYLLEQLDAHELVHEETGVYDCDYCNRMFKEAEDLRKNLPIDAKIIGTLLAWIKHPLKMLSSYIPRRGRRNA